MLVHHPRPPPHAQCAQSSSTCVSAACLTSSTVCGLLHLHNSSIRVTFAYHLLVLGLPVEVRDRVLAEAAAKAPGGHSLALAQTATAATSDVNRQFAIQQAEAAMQAGAAIPYTNAAGVTPEAHEALMRLNRHQAYYQRNAPKLCSFFARGECNRGSECPYRHEMPRDKDDPLAKQNYRDRYYGTNDPVAAKLLVRVAERSERSIESMPENDDPTACTVWVGGVIEGGVQEEQLR